VKITGLRGWNDVGYVQGGIEQPSISTITTGLAAGSEDVKVTSDLHPAIADQFSKLKVPITAWEDWRMLSYIEVTMTPNANTTPATSYIYYGWVDRVSLISDTSGQAVVQIDWTVDWWRTFLTGASLDAGRILRRPFDNEADTPIQGYPYKYRTSGLSTLISPMTAGYYETWWILAAVSDTLGSDKVVRYISWPINGNYDLYSDDGAVPPVQKKIITTAETFSGLWDEIVGVDPSAVLGAWLLPYPPMTSSQISGDGYATNMHASTFWKDVIVTHSIGGSPVDRVFFETLNVQNPYGYFPSKSGTITEFTSTEKNPIFLTGFTYEKILEVPVGMSIKNYTYRVMASATECYLEIRFAGGNSRTEGLCLTIPAPALDLTENAWSSYQYSGQREYDIDARNLATVQQGIEGTISGGVQGGIMGGFSNIGAGLGAIAGVTGAATAALIDYAVINPEVQRFQDRLHAKQTAGILISGSAMAVFVHGTAPLIALMSPDAYSASLIAAERAQKGIAVDEECADCGTQVGTGGGYWRISELIVTGDIPVEAKRFIASRFDAGVRLT